MLASGAYAKEKNKKVAPFRIKLNISATENIRAKLKNCLTNGLTAYKDVILVDAGAGYEISVKAIEARVKGSVGPNIVLSVIIASPLPRDIVNREKLLTNLNPFQASYMRNFFSKSRILLDHWLKLVEPAKLASACKEIAVDFNAKYLEKTRKLFNRSIQNPTSQNAKPE